MIPNKQKVFKITAKEMKELLAQDRGNFRRNYGGIRGGVVKRKPVVIPGGEYDNSVVGGK